MVSNRELLKCVRTIQSISIQLENSSTITAHYRSVCEIDVGGRINDNFKTYLVQTPKLNFVSRSRLNGYRIKSTSKRRKCILTDRKDRATFENSPNRDGSGFTLQKVLQRREANVNFTGANTESSHDRARQKSDHFYHNMMAHANMSDIKEMTREGQYGMGLMNQSHYNTSNICVRRKQRKTSSHQGLIERSQSVTIHADLCRQLQTPSSGEFCYFLILVTMP